MKHSATQMEKVFVYIQKNKCTLAARRTSSKQIGLAMGLKTSVVSAQEKICESSLGHSTTSHRAAARHQLSRQGHISQCLMQVLGPEVGSFISRFLDLSFQFHLAAKTFVNEQP